MRANWAGYLRSDKPGLGPREFSLSGQWAKITGSKVLRGSRK